MIKFLREYTAPISAFLAIVNSICFVITGNVHFLVTALGLAIVWFFYG